MARYMFSDINISQGSVATALRGGGLCNDPFIANFLLSVTVKEFLIRKPCCSFRFKIHRQHSLGLQLRLAQLRKPCFRAPNIVHTDAKQNLTQMAIQGH